MGHWVYQHRGDLLSELYLLRLSLKHLHVCFDIQIFGKIDVVIVINIQYLHKFDQVSTAYKCFIVWNRYLRHGWIITSHIIVWYIIIYPCDRYLLLALKSSYPLQWCHNGCDRVLNHWHLDCLLNRLFRHRSKKTSKLCVKSLCEGIHQWPVDSPHKGPVTRKMFQFDDTIMHCYQWWLVPEAGIYGMGD